jgi:hypothetical protein
MNVRHYDPDIRAQSYVKLSLRECKDLEFTNAHRQLCWAAVGRD